MVEIAQTSFAKNLRPRTIVAAGDSITLGATAAASPAEYALGYAEASIYQANMRLLYNAGVGADTSGRLRARYQADVLDKDPDAVLLMIGTNNLVSGMANSAYASLFDDVEAMVLAGRDLGIQTIIVTPPPKNSAVTESKRAQPFYHWLAEYHGLPLIDGYSLTVDPATGQFKSGYSSDGTHPNNTGIAALFPPVGAALADLPSFVGNPYLAAVSESSVGDLANMVRNGSFALGTAPSSITGWTTNTTNNTITLENPTYPETGKVCKHVVSADGNIYGLSGTSFSVTAGDELILSGKLKTSNIVSATGGAHIEFALTGGGQTRPIKSALLNGEWKFSNAFTVPSGRTAATPQLFLSRIGTYEVSNLTVVNRTAMAAIWQPGQQ